MTTCQQVNELLNLDFKYCFMDRTFTNERSVSIFWGEDYHFTRLTSFDGGDFVLKEDVIIGFVELANRMLAFASAFHSIGLRSGKRYLNVNILVMCLKLGFA